MTEIQNFKKQKCVKMIIDLGQPFTTYLYGECIRKLMSGVYIKEFTFFINYDIGRTSGKRSIDYVIDFISHPDHYLTHFYDDVTWDVDAKTLTLTYEQTIYNIKFGYDIKDICTNENVIEL